MFPTIRVSFSGVDQDSKYIVLMDIVPVDNKRYRYAYHRSSWLVAGKADPPLPARYSQFTKTPADRKKLQSSEGSSVLITGGRDEGFKPENSSDSESNSKSGQLFFYEIYFHD